jgi:hypothetical protein
VETCRRLSLPVRDYLGSVLPGLADFHAHRLGCPQLTVETLRRHQPRR